jgi:hypothetical protein
MFQLQNIGKLYQEAIDKSSKISEKDHTLIIHKIFRCLIWHLFPEMMSHAGDLSSEFRDNHCLRNICSLTCDQ